MAADPEILPPRVRTSPATDEALDHLATLLDDAFQIPGTKIRYGLDSLIGLIPGLGDVITGLMSLVIVYAGWQRGIPKITQARMMMNIVIDTALGAIPIFGDAFDVAWKANRMNMRLLKRASYEPSRKNTLSDWLFFLLLLVVAFAIVAVPVVVLVTVVKKIWP
jgi:nitrate reductase NapE component